MKRAAIVVWAAMFGLAAQGLATPDLISGAGWSESIVQEYDRGTDTFGARYLRAPHQNIAPVSNYAVPNPETTVRAVHTYYERQVAPTPAG